MRRTRPWKPTEARAQGRANAGRIPLVSAMPQTRRQRVEARRKGAGWLGTRTRPSTHCRRRAVGGLWCSSPRTHRGTPGRRGSTRPAAAIAPPRLPQWDAVAGLPSAARAPAGQRLLRDEVVPTKLAYLAGLRIFQSPPNRWPGVRELAGNLTEITNRAQSTERSPQQTRTIGRLQLSFKGAGADRMPWRNSRAGPPLRAYEILGMG
jgi:hypothetical protein